MTPEQFCYWLQGFAEITSKANQGPTPEQWIIINEHLQTVFMKVTPEHKLDKLRSNQELEDKFEKWRFDKLDPWKVTCSFPPQT